MTNIISKATANLSCMSDYITLFGIKTVIEEDILVINFEDKSVLIQDNGIVMSVMGSDDITLGEFIQRYSLLMNQDNGLIIALEDFA